MQNLIFLILFNAYSSLSGIINIGITDVSGQLISKATGFMVNDLVNNKKYILSSFHVLNVNLLVAENIVDIENNNSLSILAYDEELDILVLDGTYYNNEHFNFKHSCTLNNLVVAAYYKNNLRYANLKNVKVLDSFEDGIKRTSTYLPKGFSGAPVLDEKAYVCGMVLLSSEGNSSSIYIDSNLIIKTIANKVFKRQNISSIRQNLGLELEFDNNNTLNNYLKSKESSKQSIIILKPEINNQKYSIDGASNFILKSDESISSIELNNARNVLLVELNIEDSLIVNNSNNISIVASKFISNKALISILASSNILVKNNKFTNVNGIYVSENSKDYKIEDNYLF